jgi:hypothetical protein
LPASYHAAIASPGTTTRPSPCPTRVFTRTVTASIIARMLTGARSVGLVVLVACGYPPLPDANPGVGRTPPAGALVWLPMEDTDPTREIVDSAGHRDVSCSACPVPVPGRHGNGFRFGGDQHLQIAFGRAIKDAYTVGVWVYLESYPSDKPDVSHSSCAFTKPSGIPDDDGNSFSLCVDSDRRAYEYTTNNDTTMQSHDLYGLELPLTEWHHLAASWDGASRTKTFYYDGSPNKEKVNIGFDNGVLVVGADANPDASEPRSFWDGILDDVVLYDRVLTPEELCDLAEQPASCSLR